MSRFSLFAGLHPLGSHDADRGRTLENFHKLLTGIDRLGVGAESVVIPSLRPCTRRFSPSAADLSPHEAPPARNAVG